MRLRLLPIAAFVATTLLTVKVTAFWQGLEAFVAETFYAQPALARSPPQAQPAAQPAAAPSAQSPAQPATPAERAGGEAQGTPAAGSGSADDPMLMPQSEIDLLQKLSQRRTELEGWSNDLSMREQLLKAAELRIESKVAEQRTVGEGR